ncbi:glycosyltransferase [Janibacter hoylei]|uniref:glycosyltransferase n=1 Tax=Janibacter hoylei TaxID=364298 RepID=UPI0014615071|nr:glycosyltransferase [Janibacter hoylei]
MHQLTREFTLRARRGDLLYANSLFDLRYSILPSILWVIWGKGSNIALAPRGELHPGALAIKARKKRLFISLLRTLGVLRQVTWHATNQDELNHILKVFPGASTLVSENQTLLGTTATLGRPPNNPRQLIYAGRITPKKGLDILIISLASVDTPAVLNVCGGFRQDERAYAEDCIKQANQLPSHIVVNFLGPIPHDTLLGMYAQHDLAVTPTAGENFGHAFAEALAHSCPIMVPPTTPWTATAERLGTLVPDLDPENWAHAIRRYLNSTDAEILSAKKAAGAEYESWHSMGSSSSHLFARLTAATT